MIRKNFLPPCWIGPFPSFELQELKEPARIVSMADLNGKPALVNVWATWCVSCRLEHPTLLELSRKGVRIIGLNYKDHRDQAIGWLERLKDPYEFNIYDQEGTLGLDLGVYGAPETFLVDSQGVVRYKRTGVVDNRVWSKEIAPLWRELTGESLSDIPTAAP